NAESKSIHPAFVELLIPVFKQDQEVFLNYPRGVLMREVCRPLRELSEELLRAFPSWTMLQQIKDAESLCAILIEWSQHWNIDTNWCRDYAVAALCDWLTDDWFQWQLPGDNWRLIFSGGITEVSFKDIWEAHTNLLMTAE